MAVKPRLSASETDIMLSGMQSNPADIVHKPWKRTNQTNLHISNIR